MKLSWIRILSIGLLLCFDGTLVCADTGVKIQKVWPEKLINRQNSEATITITLRNYADTDQEPRLVCELVTGIEKTEVIFDRKVKVLAGDTLNLPVKFNTGNREWGALVRARILDEAGKIISEGDEVFGISDNFYKLSVGYAFIHSGRAIGAEGLRNIAAERRKAYWPVVEYYMGLHSNWALNQWVLETEKWLGGGVFYESKATTKAFIDAAHKEGLGVVVYNIPGLCGPAGADFAREHPEWLVYVNGRPTYFSLSVEAIDKLRNPDIDQQEKESLYSSVALYTGILFTDPAAMDYEADQIIEVSKYYNLDGIRWDGYPMLMSAVTVEGGVDTAGGCNYRGVSMTAG